MFSPITRTMADRKCQQDTVRRTFPTTIYFNSAIVTRISGIPFYRHDPNEASKLLLVHRGCAGEDVAGRGTALQIRLVTYHCSVRRMHYSLSAVFSRAVYFISIRSDRARWRAFQSDRIRDTFHLRRRRGLDTRC